MLLRPVVGLTATKVRTSGDQHTLLHKEWVGAEAHVQLIPSVLFIIEVKGIPELEADTAQNSANSGLQQTEFQLAGVVENEEDQLIPFEEYRTAPELVLVAAPTTENLDNEGDQAIEFHL
jgi:hypothetical protein